ncbi:MAG: hypothetical protein ABEJ06_04460, partial [Haloarculaceae archaeon]
MRPRTLVVLGILVFLVGGIATAAFTGGQQSDLKMSTMWVSDTPRNNTVNHHGVGASEGVVVAPVTAQPGAPNLTRRSCS